MSNEGGGERKLEKTAQFVSLMSVLFIRCYWGDHIEEAESGGACSMDGGGEKCVEGLGREKLKGEVSLEGLA
jgi:hypothetical protein